MGGSLAAACRKKFPSARILGVSRNRAALRQALQKKWIHAAVTLSEAAQQSDFFVLCTPVNTFQKMLSELDRSTQPGTVVTDVGSVKGNIGTRRFRNITFVGAHPMAGSHARGIQAARPDLYEQGFTFVMKNSNKRVKNFWKKISPRVIEVRAGEHDKIVGQISHLPHAVATALTLSPDASSLRHAASGFCDTTRIAQGDASIWLPIFMENRHAVLRAMKTFEKNFSKLKHAIERKDTARLNKLLNLAAGRRKSLGK